MEVLLAILALALALRATPSHLLLVCRPWIAVAESAFRSKAFTFQTGPEEYSTCDLQARNVLRAMYI